MGTLRPPDATSAASDLVPPVDTFRPDGAPARLDGARAPDADLAETGQPPGDDAGTTYDSEPVGDAAGAHDREPVGLDGSASPDTGEGPEAAPTSPVTVVVMPDTQYYAAAYPDVFAGQTSWILAQQPALNIAAVLHVGDIVDGFNDPKQWTVASTAMRPLDGIVPYVLVPGNHDTDVNRMTPIDTYFGPASMPWITGTMVAGQIENNYALLDIGPQQWLVLGLEFGPRDAVVAWADQVLKAYPDRPAILVTHAYLYADGNRYDVALSNASHQAFIPQDYGYTASQGINDGEMLWQKLVLPNPNVRMVFCGHDSAAARLTSTRPDGSRVHQMLSDYQWYGGPSFGYGYLRVVQLNYGKKTIAVQTYSPYLDQYLTDDANQFVLDWNL